MTEILAIQDAPVVPPFVEFPSIARMARGIIITEKIDGTNAQVHITEDGRLFAGSRTRWITPAADNFGFAAWVQAHRDELLALGPGSHFGEWWGSGIQRGYGLKNGDKRFSLFNVGRWVPVGGLLATDKQAFAPACCGVVPVLYSGPFVTSAVDDALGWLRENGSAAAPGFKPAEGVVVFHEQSRTLFKQTLDGDGHKGAKAH